MNTHTYTSYCKRSRDHLAYEIAISRVNHSECDKSQLLAVSDYLRLDSNIYFFYTRYSFCIGTGLNTTW